MEKQEINTSLIILGSLAIIVIAIIILLFIIDQKRKMYSLKSMNETLENQRDDELQAIRNELSEIRQQMDNLTKKNGA